MSSSEAGRGTKHVRIAKSTHDRIEELSKISRLSCSEIANRAILFALRHVREVPVKCYDIQFGDEEEFS